MRICRMGKARLDGEWIRYYLLLNSRARSGYGICVAYGGEVVVIPGITSSEMDARRLLHRMVRGRITPVSAQDVVEDWLCGGSEEI